MRDKRLATAPVRYPRLPTSAEIKIPRFHRVAVARIPSGRAKMMERTVPARAVPTVCTAARKTVRRKLSETSGGNEPARKCQIVASVAGRRRILGSTSANRQETAIRAIAKPSQSTSPGVLGLAADAGALSNTTEFVVDVLAIAFFGCSVILRVQSAQKGRMNLGRRHIEGESAAAQANCPRKVS